MSPRALAILSAGAPPDDPIVESAEELTVGHIRRALALFDWRYMPIPGRPGPLAWLLIASMMRCEEDLPEA